LLVSNVQLDQTPAYRLAVTGDEIVDDGYVAAPSLELLDGVRANVAGSAGY
jgi:hypothetical protein